MFPFYTPSKHHEIKAFLVFSGGFKMEALAINCLNFWYNIYPEIINWN